MNKIQMVDLAQQYEKIKPEVDQAILNVINSTAFIKGPEVTTFEENLTTFLSFNGYCISCGNGTDALQIAMMALGLKAGDEILIPAFTYIATAEAAALLGIKPVFVDVDPHTFMLNPNDVERKITTNTKAILPVHLYGQCANMEAVLELAKKHHLFIIEDTAQALGADYLFENTYLKAGTIGDIGITSFFPSKNLGCYGDGGALFTKDKSLAEKIRMIANHGQQEKYYHDVIGVNSRLDTIQATVLIEKLKYLSDYIKARQQVADFYDNKLKEISGISIPGREKKSTHVFHQYTLRVANNKRDDLKAFLQEKDIPSVVYYPVPIPYQKAFTYLNYKKGDFPISERLSNEVLSLPIHTEMDKEQMTYITGHILDYFT